MLHHSPIPKTSQLPAPKAACGRLRPGGRWVPPGSTRWRRRPSIGHVEEVQASSLNERPRGREKTKELNCMLQDVTSGREGF